MTNETTLTTTTDFRFLTKSPEYIEIEEIQRVHDEIQQRVIHRLNLQDAAIRQALIDLGWTPPELS